MSRSSTAFEYHTIVPTLSHKIESIETWGMDKFIVGTTEGVLFVYEVTDNRDPSQPFKVDCVNAQKTFSRKPITQLDIIDKDKLKLLLSLSDNVVSVHDMPSFYLRAQIAKTRGCHMYALDRSKSTPMLCVAIKKKLLIMSWDGSEFVEVKELSVPDLAKTLLWCGDRICVGFKKEYNMIDISTGEIIQTWAVGKLGAPLGIVLPNQQILLEKEQTTIFFGFDGRPIRTWGLSWTEAPAALGYSFPYVLAVLPKGVIEVRTVSEAKMNEQTLQIRAKLLAWREEVDGQPSGAIYAANQTTIWKMVPVPILTQVEKLIKEKEYEEGLNLCEFIPHNYPGRAAKIKNIKILYAHHLFLQGQFDHAMENFEELECDPLQVVGLYPGLLPKLVRDQFSYPVEIQELGSAASEKAYVALTMYLRKRANKTLPLGDQKLLPDDFQIVKTPEVIIDTALLKAYIRTNNDSALIQLLRRPNNCHFKESEKALSAKGKFAELVLLYRSKEAHALALQLLAKYAQSKSSGPLSGPQETINYLKSLGREHIDLILQYSEWVLQVAPDAGLEIFTEPRDETQSLPAPTVVQHIKAHAPLLVVPFLIFSIHKRNDTTPEFHNELAFFYLDSVQNLQKDPQYRQYRNVPAGSEPGQLGVMRKKLLTFLDESKYYTPEKMLSKFPFDDLLEERAILLSRIGQHEQALNIYVHKLQNNKMAEVYCEKNYHPDREDSRDVYLSLLKVYLKTTTIIDNTQSQSQQSQSQVQAALNILNKHHLKIDVAKALDLLPSNILIKDLSSMFENVMRENNKNRRNNQVVKNLLKSESIQVREQLIKSRSPVIKIDDDRICPVCNKRLLLSAFARYPNGVTVHFICSKDKQVCPVTGTDFKKIDH